MRIYDLDTPCEIIDLPALERNLQRMQAGADSLGVRLRPHAKTHKTREIAQLQQRLGAGGIVVAKTAEAEILFATAGGDVLVANQVVAPAKIRRLCRLAQEGRVGVLFDSEEGLRRLAGEGRDWPRKLDVYLEINITDLTGHTGRCGVPPGEEAQRLARLAADSPALCWRGITGYRGVPKLFASTSVPDPLAEVERAGKEEGAILADFAAELRAAGIPVEVVAAGSTATALTAGAVPGISEIHPGEYVFYGGIHLGPGYCTLADCALSILTTVISTPARNRAVVDAGKKMLSGDFVAAHYPHLHLADYGLVLSPEGQPLPGIRLTALSEEHGVLTLAKGAPTLKVGSMLRVIPDHVCTVVNLADTLWVQRDGIVEGSWQVAARGAVQ